MRCVLLAGILLLASALAQGEDRIALVLDTSEAEAVLGIVAQKQAGKPIAEADWRRLFATEPYSRLKKREAELKRDFTDAEFREFVLSDQTARRAPELRQVLEQWKQADLHAAAERVLAYLPADARIRAKIFPVIKPKANSFVFEATTDPAIFLYLDPAESPAKFANTVAHELHHIGYASISAGVEKLLAGLPPNVRPAAEWMGAFGEGFAMLAAVGSPNLHPHAFSSAEDRARWDRDMAHFNQDLEAVQAFFLDMIHGKLKTEQQQHEAGFAFFGVQGPWYTVGYKMAAMVETAYGRPALIECMKDPRLLLRRYNTAAQSYNATHADKLALWSPELLKAVGP